MDDLMVVTPRALLTAVAVAVLLAGALALLIGLVWGDGRGARRGFAQGRELGLQDAEVARFAAEIDAYNEEATGS